MAAILRMEFPELEDLVDGSDDGDLDSEEDGEIGGSQRSAASDALSVENISAAHISAAGDGDS